MAKKREIIDELKKFNSDLEKHLPKLDFDFLKEDNVFKKDNVLDDEFTTLLANNLVDLKTEIALVRKNLVDNVEGMVLRVMNEQQNNFTKHMNDFYSKLSVGVKSSLSDYVEEMVSEFSGVKKSLDSINLVNKNFSEKFDSFENDLLELKSVSENLGDFKTEMKRLIEKKFEEVDSKLSALDSRIISNNKDFKSELKRVDEILIGTKSKFDDSIKNLSLRYDDMLDENREISKGLSGFNKEIKKIESSIVNLDTSSKNIHQIKNESKKTGDNIDKNNFKEILKGEVLSKSDCQIDDTVSSKLLNLDSRLKKLDSLRY